MKRRIRATHVLLAAVLAAPALLLGAQAAQASWTLETVPTPSGITSPYPYGLSCATATTCIAVGVGLGGTGGDGNESFAEDWNGTSWTAASVADAQTVSLDDVSCSSATACTAVGSLYGADGGTPAAERWNGTKWTVQTLPAPDGSSGLDGVSCPTATTCVAVGAENESPIAETWNGSTWTLSYPPATDNIGLAGVSCMSATSCVAMGSSPPEGMASSDIWNGTSWKAKAVAVPLDAVSTVLGDVSCTSSSCQAVGDYLTGPAEDALAESWDGTSWTVETTPYLGSNTAGVLGSVSCASGGACNAVGQETVGSSTTSTLLDEHWNGTNWSVHTILTPAGAPAELLAVSCVSGASCQSIGSYTPSAGTSMFAEQGS
jgi:hypothetical protein